MEKYFTNSKIIIINKIVSKDKESIFYICDEATGISTADIQWVTKSRFCNQYKWKSIEGIETISLDHLIEINGTPNFIKIDVECYEYNVILSLTKKSSNLTFEWAEEKLDELINTIEYLNTLGYNLFAIQMKDSYKYNVPDNDWITREEIISTLKNISDPYRKSLWGMIWCK